MRAHSWGPLLTTTAMATVLLTGCGESEADKFKGQSAEEMAEVVKAAMNDLEGVTIDGTLTSDGQEIEIEMEIGSKGNCNGEFSTQGASAEILGVDGTTWFRPDEEFWALQAGEEAAAQIVAAVGDKWVRLAEGDTSFAEFCDIESFVDAVNEENDNAYSKGETKEIDGEETIEIISEGDDQTTSGFVQTGGDHYLVRIEVTEGDEPGTVDFSDFNEQPDIEAPAEDEDISMEELQGGGY